MTDSKLVLTEKAIKAHSKRLHRELKDKGFELTLNEAQTLFSKSLGFNNFHDVKSVLKNEKNFEHPFTQLVDSFEFKRNECFYVICVTPVMPITPSIQDELKNIILKKEKQIFSEYINEQRKYINRIHIDECKCVLYLDPNSNFSKFQMEPDKSIRYTEHGVLQTLLRVILIFLESKGHTKFYNAEYGFKKVHQESKYMSLEFHDILVERET